MTGSVNYIKVRNTEYSSVTDMTSVDWYDEHFKPIERLYEYYSRYNPEYFIGCHDFYSIYFQQNLIDAAPVVSFTGSILNTMSSSFTIESWIKPTFVTSSIHDFTISGQRLKWRFYISGSNGHLAFTDFSTVVSSSAILTPGIWSHVVFSSDGTSGSFYLNGALDARIAFTGTLSSSFAITGTHLTVGAAYILSGALNSVKAFHGFNGFIFENKIWSTSKTSAQISSSYNKTLKPNEFGSNNLIHYSRFNDGPLSTYHGFTKGSGAFDYSNTAKHGRFVNFRSVLPVSPLWQPNDNKDFYTYKTRITSSDFIRIFNVPSLYYGRQIATGSIEIECRAYDDQYIIRKINDDGRGNLYISGSLLKHIGQDEYKGVSWRKVGSVFYSEGIIVISDPSLFDFGESQDSSQTTDLLRLTFSGEQRTSTKTFMCRAQAGDCNMSNNPTFSYIDPNDPEDLTDDFRIVKGTDTYITAVGIYDDERRLVAVAKLAQPIRKKARENLTIRLRYDI